MAGKPPIQGSINYMQPNKNDVENKLTYQQLLIQNKNLTAEIDGYRNLNTRLAKQLEKLHTHFDINEQLESSLTNEQRGLYGALQTETVLYKYLVFINPLFICYDHKVQKLQQAYESLSKEFQTVERKFEEIMNENAAMKLKLEQRLHNIIEFYKLKNPEKTHQLFNDIINQQMNEKQEVFAKENAYLVGKFKEIESKCKQLSEELRTKSEKQNSDARMLKEIEKENKIVNQEMNTLKKSISELQARNRQLQISENQIQKAFDRASLQNKELNQEITILKNSLSRLRQQTENKSFESNQIGKDSKKIETLEKQLTYLKAELRSSDSFKQIDTLRKQNQNLQKAYQTVKDNLEASVEKEKLLTNKLQEFKDKVRDVEDQNNILKSSETSLKKSLTQITESSKKLSEENKRSKQDQLRKLRAQFDDALEEKQKNIAYLNQQLQKSNFEKEKIESEKKFMVTMDEKPEARIRELERQINKLKEEKDLELELYEERTKLIKQQNEQSKGKLKEMNHIRNELNEKKKQVKKISQQLGTERSENQKLNKQKQMIIEQMKKIRASYQYTLKQKQQNFDAKVKEIRTLLEDSLNKERNSKQEINQIARKYKKTIQQIRIAYEERIKDLQNQIEVFKKKFLETPSSNRR